MIKHVKLLLSVKMYKMPRIFLLIGILGLTFVKQVSGIRLTFSKTIVVKQPGSTVLTCAVDETDVGQIFIMQIKVLVGSTMTQLGRVDDKGLTSTVPLSMADRMNLAGYIDKVSPATSRVTLGIDTEKVHCSDGTVYECGITYLTNSPDRPMSKQGSHNGTLAVFVNPEMLSMEGKLNGKTIEAPTPSKKATIKIGDQLELTCTANVGSIPSTSIQWRKTTEIGIEDLWSEYQSPQGTFAETDTVSDGNCGYTRTSTIFYTMSIADANRLNNFAFECYVIVTTPPYNNFRTTDNPRFYADISPESCKYQTNSADSSSSTQVLIGLVVAEGITCLCLIAAVAYFVVKNRGVGYKQDSQQVQRTEPERNQSTYTDLQRPRTNMETDYDVLVNADRERNPGYVNALS